MSKLTYLLLFSLIYSFFFPQHSWAYLDFEKEPVLVSGLIYLSSLNQTAEEFPDQLVMVQGNSLIQISNPINPISQGPTCPVESFRDLYGACPVESLDLYGACPVESLDLYGACPVFEKKIVIVTAYSSRPEETDASPFITASGIYVRDGIVAANFLKFGTKVKLPQLYGEKVFVVEDRLAPKNGHKVDIWMPNKEMAIQFGVKKTELIILEL